MAGDINLNDSPIRIEDKTIRRESDNLHNNKKKCKVVRKWNGRKDLVCLDGNGKISKRRIQ